MVFLGNLIGPLRKRGLKRTSTGLEVVSWKSSTRMRKNRIKKKLILTDCEVVFRDCVYEEKQNKKMRLTNCEVVYSVCSLRAVLLLPLTLRVWTEVRECEE